jgi:hypothetical protein
MRKSLDQYHHSGDTPNMEDELIPSKGDQPFLFEFAQTNGTGAMELFPAVWSALEGLCAPEAASRHVALDRLIEIGAPRLSPLVAYSLATRLADPDLTVRVRVVQIVAEILSRDLAGNVAPEAVRRHLTGALAQMRTRTIYALLEVSLFQSGLEKSIALLINSCPYAGGHLASILSDRKFPAPIRLQAANFIGRVGFLEAIPVLERLEVRLLSRINGQQAMPFAPTSLPDESELLPAVQSTLNLLRSR